MDEAHRAYYEARAREYDDWWLGRGLFAARERPGWGDEVRELERLLAALPAARTLDVACGTGFLTRHLRGLVVGLDESPTSVALAQRRLPDGVAMTGDAFALPFADRAFERVVTAHFYGHLLDEDRARFVAEAHRVGDELVVVDAAAASRARSGRSASSTTARATGSTSAGSRARRWPRSSAATRCCTRATGSWWCAREVAAARRGRCRAVVAPASVGLPVRAALLGGGAAPADHAGSPAPCVGAAAGRARAGDRPGDGLLLAAARRVAGAGGRLELFDLQQEMLDHTLRRAGELASRMTATQGDATALPYDDGSFDAAVLTCVLGEIPDQAAALREIARVLKPDGRLVVGELMGDPHVVLPGALERGAAPACAWCAATAHGWATSRSCAPRAGAPG